MAQYDYSAPPNEIITQEQKPQFDKKDDSSLPNFTKEVPLRSIVKKHGNNVMIKYEWNVLGGEEIKISIANFRKDENLQDLQHVHKIKIKDGAEIGSFTIANTTYIIRRTSEQIAKELMKTSDKIKASVLGVIGYFKTLKGNFYTISKVEKNAWALDPRLGLKTFSLSSMNEGEKKRLSDLIIEELLKLYRQGYALKNFNLLDIIVTKKKIMIGNLTALVKLGASKTVDSFIGNLKVMVKSGVSNKADVVYGIALSFGAMKKKYVEWTKNNGLENADDVRVLEEIEKNVMN